jgi:hypothetical protein
MGKSSCIELRRLQKELHPLEILFVQIKKAAALQFETVWFLFLKEVA